MSSGIYKLTFPDGSIYIGKSVDINKRWTQHSKALQKGTHTKNMQQVYDKCGAPRYEIIFECHPDHIDILENYFINLYWGAESMLNTTRPADLTDTEKEVLLNFPDSLWDMSTFEHILKWNEVSGEVKILKAKLDKSKNNKAIEKLEEELMAAKAEITRLGSRGFFARLFNL